jgi:hypothetical protein
VTVLTQVTLCYKRAGRRDRAARRARNTVLLALASLVAGGCGATAAPEGGAGAPLRPGDLPGWRAVHDPPGIGGIAPDLSRLSVSSERDSPALVRGGDVVRATAFDFFEQADAAVAISRAKGEGYAAELEAAFRGRVVRRTSAPQRVGYRLSVPRPAEDGADTAEVYVVRHGRRVVLVELVSAAGFDPGLRERILELVSR